MDDFSSQVSQKRLPLKQILIVIGAIVIAGTLIWLTVYWLGRDDRAQERLNEAQTITNAVESARDACSTALNSEKCEAQRISSSARSGGVAQLCETLDGSKRDACLFGVARETKDVELCQKIVDALVLQTCSDNISQKLALEADDAALCRDIIDEEKRSRCEQTLTPVDTTTVFYQTVEEGKRKRDPSVCAVLSDDELDGCLDFVGPADLDLDGLSADEETLAGSSDASQDTDQDGLGDFDEVRVYLTNPSKADTDGDGFKDGQEVSSGYNPSGKGRL